MTTTSLPAAAHSAHPPYRADIDGLRAVAVLIVVIFHIFPELLKGGFIGVDIFFVMSGYLISTIIYMNLRNDKFSLYDFYARRIKRIFPALLLVLLATYALGWMILFPVEYKALAKHIMGGAGFISNIILWKESGYFDTASDAKPLLHLWSLGIEEQFYIVWPLVLWFAWKRKFSLLGATAAAILASFVLGLLKLKTDPTAAFFFPHTRFWELLCGSALAYVTLFRQPLMNKITPGLANAMSGAGAALLVAGIALISNSSAFPGWWALMPTVAACLIIAAGPQAWFNRNILATRFMIWFGLISFPLYLWHWPLLAYSHVLYDGALPLANRLAILALSVLLAWATFRLVEKPLRFGGYGNAKVAGLAFTMVLVFAVGFVSFDLEKKGGLPRAFLERNAVSASGYDGMDGGVAEAGCGIADAAQKSLFNTCVSDKREQPKYALLGDSKALALYTGLFRTSTGDGRWLFIGGNGKNGAPTPVLTNNKLYASVQNNTITAVNAIAANPHIETVAIAAATREIFRIKSISSLEELPDNKNYDAALEGVQNVANKFIAAGKKVVFVVDNPTLADPVNCLKRDLGSPLLARLLQNSDPHNCEISKARQLQLTAQYRKLLETVQKSDPAHIAIFDTLDILCEAGDGGCTPYKNQRLLYSYSDHISDYAAGLIGQKLNAFLNSGEGQAGGDKQAKRQNAALPTQDTVQ